MDYRLNSMLTWIAIKIHSEPVDIIPPPELQVQVQVSPLLSMQKCMQLVVTQR